MWSELNADDLLSALTQPERDLFGTGDSGPGSGDRLDAIVGWVVDQVRGKVAALPENRGVMGATGTLPPELYGAAIAIARYMLLTSFPAGRMFLDDARTRAYTDALKQLDDAAEGKLIVEPGTTATFTANASAFGSRDDYLCDPTKRPNRNVLDFGFW
jgi:Protein of unknown function (DUF1320)